MIIDWQQIIKDLHEADGIAMQDIAKLCGISPQALTDIKQGRSTEPRGMAAVKLHKMWTRRKRKAA